MTAQITLRKRWLTILATAAVSVPFVACSHGPIRTSRTFRPSDPSGQVATIRNRQNGVELIGDCPPPPDAAPDWERLKGDLRLWLHRGFAESAECRAELQPTESETFSLSHAKHVDPRDVHPLILRLGRVSSCNFPSERKAAELVLSEIPAGAVPPLEFDLGFADAGIDRVTSAWSVLGLAVKLQSSPEAINAEFRREFLAFARKALSLSYLPSTYWRLVRTTRYLMLLGTLELNEKEQTEFEALWERANTFSKKFEQEARERTARADAPAIGSCEEKYLSASTFLDYLRKTDPFREELSHWVSSLSP